MGKIREFFSGKSIEVEPALSEEYNGFIVKNALDKNGANVNPNFKGIVTNNKIKFPTALGCEHPFNFGVTEGLYKKFGFSTAVIDKYVDYIVGPGFWVNGDDEKANKIITDWMNDVAFDSVLRMWVKEALTKNGFLEIGGGKDEVPKGLKVLDSKYMYVDRDKKGVIEGYNQYIGEIDKFAKNKINSFEPYQIAHIGFNKIGDMAYGLGIVWPAVNTINNLLQNEKDLHMLMSRKANSPYHIKMGGVVGGKYFKPNPTTLKAYSGDLQWLNNKHEWVTDGLTEIKVVDFGNIGEKFNEVLKYDTEMLLYTFQVPAVIMGMANINEGVAKTQMDGFERRITSFQSEIEKVIEEKIFRRVLNSQGIDSHVEFNWGRPSNAERYERIDRITNLIKIPTVSQTLISMMEKDLIKNFELDEKEYDKMIGDEKVRNEEERKKEEARSLPLVPGQNATPAKPVVKQSLCPSCLDVQEDFGKYNTINEWLGFNYGEYKNEIEKFVKAYGYEFIKAKNLIEEAAGMLNVGQVDKFKGILEKGFKNGSSISDMVKEVNAKVGLKDLLKMEEGKIVEKDGEPVKVRGKDKRAVSIVRTEVTRAANAGAVNFYKENGIKKVKWVSSVGTRTCEQCDALNNNIYEIGEQPEIPVHPMCRCTLTPVTELS